MPVSGRSSGHRIAAFIYDTWQLSVGAVLWISQSAVSRFNVVSLDPALSCNGPSVGCLNGIGYYIKEDR